MKINKNKKTSMKIPLVLSMLIVVLAILQIILANQETTRGRVLQKIEEEVEQLEAENKILEAEIAYSGSLEFLKEKAISFDFNQEQLILNLTTQKEVALKF